MAKNTQLARRPIRRTGRVVAVAGTAVVASALVLGVVGCVPTTRSSIQITSDGVTVSDGSETRTYTLPEVDLASDADRSVTVTGTDSIAATPDMATVSLGVRAQADTAAQAQDDAANTVDEVKKSLVGMGIDEENIATSNLYLNPSYDYSSSTESIVGYEMSVSIEVKNLTLDEAGKAIATATAAGANSVGGVTYYCSNYDELYAQALEKALAMAEGKASTLAAANGDELGSVLSATEGYDGQHYRTNETKTSAGAVTMDSAAAADEAASIDIDPGTITVEASVTVEYAVSRAK